MGLIELFLAAWLVMRLGRAVKEEYQHSRDIHATRLSREHSDWSPGRIRRNARRRARGDWLDEIGGGFPTLRRMVAEDRLLAKTIRAEQEADGEARIRDLRERLDKAAARREEARRAPGAKPRKRVTPEPEAAPVEPGTGTGVPDAEPGDPVEAEPGSDEMPEPAGRPVFLPEGPRVPGTPEPDDDPEADADTVAAAPAGSRGGDAPSLDGPMPPPLMTKGELDHYRQTGDFVAGAGRDDSAGWPDDNWPDGDAVPDPPNDETADDTTEKEGDGEMTTDIESAETPYQGMQSAFQDYAKKANQIATEAGDDLGAQAAIHGFDRDPQVMADLQKIQDAASAVVVHANAAHAGLIARHAGAEEYHGTGQDADASAFRPQ